MAIFGASKQDLQRYTTLIQQGSMTAPSPSDYFVVDGDYFVWSSGSWHRRYDVQGEIGGLLPVYTPLDPLTGIQSLVSGGGNTSADTGFDVVLLAGQSNMAGRCSTDAFADWLDGSVLQYGCYSSDSASFKKIGMLTEPMKGGDTTLASGRTGPGPWFARAFAQMLPSNRRLLVLNTAIGGTTLVGGPWAVGGAHYVTSVARVQEALALAQQQYPSSRFLGTVWIQGESDGDANVSTVNYQAGLTATISGLRAAIPGGSASFFVIGGMVPEAISSHSGYPAIQAAHLAVAASDALVAYVPGVPGYSSDSLHYTTRPGPQMVGRALATAAYGLYAGTSGGDNLANAVTLTGPSSGTSLSPSTNFTVTANGAPAASVTVTPSSTLAGAFTPSSVTLGPGATSATFTFTAATTGTATVSISNSGGLTNSGTVAYTAEAGASPASAVTLSGPTAATVGSASTAFTVGANGTITGTVVVTPSDGGNGGTFTPSTVSISSGSPTGAFTYTPASAGTKTISVTNSGGLANPSSISLTASAGGASSYTFESDTVGAAPANIAALSGLSLIVENSGVTGWSGKWMSVNPSGYVTTTSYAWSFAGLVPAAADQTLTWDRKEQTSAVRDGFMLRGQPGGASSPGGSIYTGWLQGYFFQTSSSNGALRIYRFDAASVIQIGSFTYTPGSANKYRASAIGSTLKFEYSTDGGGTWSTAITVTDTTYADGRAPIIYGSGFAATAPGSAKIDNITLT